MRSGLSIVAGPAASGKGTLARMPANFLHFSHLDTGLPYRLVTYLWSRGLGGRKSAELQTADAMSADAGDAAVSIAHARTRADIVACGRPTTKATSLQALGHHISMHALDAALLRSFPHVFGHDLRSCPLLPGLPGTPGLSGP